jgi:hypothetical protein
MVGIVALYSSAPAVLLRTQEPRVTSVALAALGSCFRRNTKMVRVRA